MNIDIMKIYGLPVVFQIKPWS